MFKLTPRDTFGIEKWTKSFREQAKKGGSQKHTEAEKDAIYKECKVGKYREWQFSETRYKEIVQGCEQSSKEQYRRKVYTWLKTNKPELAHLSWEEIVELGLHQEMYRGHTRGFGRLSYLKEEVKDLEYM